MWVSCVYLSACMGAMLFAADRLVGWKERMLVVMLQGKQREHEREKKRMEGDHKRKRAIVRFFSLPSSPCAGLKFIPSQQVYDI